MIKLREVLEGVKINIYIYEECPTRHQVKTDGEMRDLRVRLLHTICCLGHLPFIRYLQTICFESGPILDDGASQVAQWERPGLDPCLGKIPWSRKWQPTPVFLPGESCGQRSLVGYSPLGRREWDTAEQLSTTQHLHWMMRL